MSSNISCCCSFTFFAPKALPSSKSPHCLKKSHLYTITSQFNPLKLHKKIKSISKKHEDCSDVKKFSLACQIGALLTTIGQPALAVTGVNDEEDLIWVLIQLAIVAFGYLIVMPPIIMNWLRIRWYRRQLFEMYLQFMCIFIFFPGILLWAPFLNFRKFPRDPTMKYPWSVPENPSEIKNDYRKYPYATPEDYD